MPTQKPSQKQKSGFVPKPPEHVEVWFDLRDGSYWLNLNGRFVALKKADVRMHMRARGLSTLVFFDGQQEVDWPMYNAQLNRQVDYAGSLAGHRIGIYQDGSSRNFLVTDEARGVWEEPAKKTPEPEFFKEFIQELLQENAICTVAGGHSYQVQQWEHFCYWLAIGLRSLRKSDFRPGQVAFLVGPAQCGKSLLQFIITEILGGRAANPWGYMTGDKFNYDLAGAEHWMIEDPNTTTDMRSRVALGNKLKECANNETFNIHRKNKDPLSIAIMRRLSASLNNEPESIAMIPPMDLSIRDKACLYNCSRAVDSLRRFVEQTPALPGMSLPDGDFDRSKVKALIRSEVPLIRAWLLRNFRTVPKELRDNRYGIVAAHHPELLDELSQMSIEFRILSLIDEVVFDKENPCPWTGKAIDLEKQLRASDFGFEFEKALRHVGQLGSYLGKLSKSMPQRISKRLLHGYTDWIISTPPSLTKDTTYGVQDSTEPTTAATATNGKPATGAPSKERSAQRSGVGA